MTIEINVEQIKILLESTTRSINTISNNEVRNQCRNMLKNADNKIQQLKDNDEQNLILYITIKRVEQYILDKDKSKLRIKIDGLLEHLNNILVLSKTPQPLDNYTAFNVIATNLKLTVIKQQKKFKKTLSEEENKKLQDKISKLIQFVDANQVPESSNNQLDDTLIIKTSKAIKALLQDDTIDERQLQKRTLNLIRKYKNEYEAAPGYWNQFKAAVNEIIHDLGVNFTLFNVAKNNESVGFFEIEPSRYMLFSDEKKINKNIIGHEHDIKNEPII